MVKRRSSLPSPEKKTIHQQFFKVFIPTQSSQRLRIPPDFIKHFNGETPSKSTITSSEPRSWPVDVTEIDDNLYLEKGWERFVHDNALEFGDFLVFRYAGKDGFQVKIFAKHGCLKGFAASAPTTNKPTAVPSKVQPPELSKTPRSLRPRNPDTGRVRRDRSKNISNLPFFKVVMQPAHISSGIMSIPYTFAGSYLNPEKESGLLLFSGKSWPVKLLRQKANRHCDFSAGWRPFCKENRLKVGDVCVFRLVDRKKCSFTVTISRNMNGR